MKNAILVVTSLNSMFLLMHEFDAFHQGEWRMFRFLGKLKESTQYLLFLYIHIPLTLFCFYYLWSTYRFNHFVLWLIMNSFSIVHLFLHLMAIRWKSNVFRNVHSFIFIIGWGITGVINLMLMNAYR
jgi:hypothetical protein